jgi:hypothetical protein
LEQGFKVVDCGAQKQESSVQRFVRDVLRGIVEVFVGVFYVAKDWQVGFEAIVAQGHYLVVNLLCAVMGGAYWKPIFDVRQQGVLYRLPDFGLSTLGIVRDYPLRIFG